MKIHPFMLIFLLTPFISHSMEKDLDKLLGPLEFSDTTYANVKKAMSDTVNAESELIDTGKNGMLSICKSIQQELKTEHLNAWRDKKENEQAKKMYLEIMPRLLHSEELKEDIEEIQEASSQSERKTLLGYLHLHLMDKLHSIFESTTPFRLADKSYKNLGILSKKDWLILNKHLDPIQNAQHVRSVFLCLADIDQRFPNLIK